VPRLVITAFDCINMKNSLLLIVNILFFASCQKQQYAFVPASKMEHFQLADGLVAVIENEQIEDTTIIAAQNTILAIRDTVVTKESKRNVYLRKVAIKKQLEEDQKRIDKVTTSEESDTRLMSATSAITGIGSIGLPVTLLLLTDLPVGAGIIAIGVVLGTIAMITGAVAFKRNRALQKQKRTDKKLSLTGMITGFIGVALPLSGLLSILYSVIDFIKWLLK
jgi:hypothetical protein